MTGLLTTCGQEFQDWSAPYRLFSCDRLPRPRSSPSSAARSWPSCLPRRPFVSPSTIRCSARPASASPASLGAAIPRPPLPNQFRAGAARVAVLRRASLCPTAPTAWCPSRFSTPPRPSNPPRKASPEEHQQYRQAARQARLPLLAAQQIATLRQALDAEPNGAQRQLQCVVDGGYTNETVLKKLPARTTLIGRLRKDAKLYFPPAPPPAPPCRGRPRRYGAPAPTPEQLRTDESVPWTSMEVSVSGAPHQMRVKCCGNLLWRTAGLDHTLQLVVIAPLSYRLRQGSKLLYRQPAFLICTDPGVGSALLGPGLRPTLGHRSELPRGEDPVGRGAGAGASSRFGGVGAGAAGGLLRHAAVGLPAHAGRSGQARPATAAEVGGRAMRSRASPPSARINQLRAEVWGRALGLANFSGFANRCTPTTKPEKFAPDLSSAVLYATN